LATSAQCRFLQSREELVKHSFISPHGCPVNTHGLLCRPLQSDKSGYKAAFALTKEAFWTLVLLSSLGLWAAAWAAAASFASAWLQ
jgi:hypothetical protein